MQVGEGKCEPDAENLCEQTVNFDFCHPFTPWGVVENSAKAALKMHTLGYQIYLKKRSKTRPKMQQMSKCKLWFTVIKPCFSTPRRALRKAQK